MGGGGGGAMEDFLIRAIPLPPTDSEFWLGGRGGGGGGGEGALNSEVF